jgi:hypothetical protein
MSDALPQGLIDQLVSRDLTIRCDALANAEVRAYFDQIAMRYGLCFKRKEWDQRPGQEQLPSVIYLARHMEAAPDTLSFVLFNVVNTVVSMKMLYANQEDIRSGRDKWYKHNAVHTVIARGIWQALFEAALRSPKTESGLYETVSVEDHQRLSNTNQPMTKMEIVAKEFSHKKHFTVTQLCCFADVKFKVQLRRVPSPEDPRVTQAYQFVFKCVHLDLRASAAQVAHWDNTIAAFEGVGGGSQVPTVQDRDLNALMQAGTDAVVAELGILPEADSAELAGLQAIVQDQDGTLPANDAACGQVCFVWLPCICTRVLGSSVPTLQSCMFLRRW